jgi:hypothetical protein
MANFKEFLNEQERIEEMAARRSRNRNLNKWRGKIERPVSILTAFEKGSRPLSRLVANRAANAEMVKDFKLHGLSFYPVHGMGQEEVKYLWGLIRGQNPSEEESFVVQPIADDMPENDFVAIVQSLLAKYNQFVAAMKLPSTPQAFLLHADGQRDNIGSGADDRAGEDFFTQLHGGPRATDSQLSPYELTGERNPIKRFINWWKGRSDMNRPVDRSKIGQRFSIKDPKPEELP